MPIKNYTSKVDIYQSLGEIQGALARHGACKIMVDYDGAGRPMALTFGILTQQGAVGYHLPVNVDGVLGRLREKKSRLTANRQSGRHGEIFEIGC